MPHVTALRAAAAAARGRRGAAGRGGGAAGDWVDVELDGAPWRALPATAVVRAGLGVGVELSRERARLLARERRRAIALELGVRALTSRDRSSAELAAHLERRGVGEPERTRAVAALAEGGYVDDTRFARSRSEALAERGQGDAAIRFDLEQRGLDGGAVEEALRALEPEAERARQLVARLGASPKTARALARRGFGEETLETVIGNAFAEDAGEPV